MTTTTTTGFDAVTPQIRPHPRRDGVEVVDPIQETQFALLTPERVAPADCDPDRFFFPVDVAATLATTTVETPYLVSAWIRDQTGAVVAEVDNQESVTVPEGHYSIELETTNIKLQLAVDGELTVKPLENCVQFLASGTDRIHVGARSVHEQPMGTVTTTDNPEDVMTALSTLGSALKTTRCERSFPTLRGHPPLIERGDELSIPDHVETPDTGVVIEVPPAREYVYQVASLAYYLGATVQSGQTPRLVVDDWEFALNVHGTFEETVGRVLKQVFLLDCVTRTEGYYQVDLDERKRVEDATNLDFEDLYERPIAEQLQSYFEIPYETIREVVPKWKLTADVRPTAENVSALPFLANELAVIRCPVETDVAEQRIDELAEQMESFFRNRPNAMVRGGAATPWRGGEAGGPQTRSSSSTASADEDIVRPPDAPSIEQAYVGDGIPVGASKMTVDAYYRRLEYEPSDEPQIRVAVVCNDDEMADENVVSNIYGTRDWIQFDIGFHEQLAKAELREVLRTDVDFLHYIGHVDDEGIRCTDGYLDARELPEVNISAFLLNACDSYDQGHALVDQGAMGGLTTVTDVINQAATSVGRTVARLLNQGFSLAATLALIEEYEQIGHHYMVVGDGSVSVVKNESGTPFHTDLERTGSGEFQIKLHGYPRLDTPLGTIFRPYLPEHETYYLNSGNMCQLNVSSKDFGEFISKQEHPVIERETLKWASDLLSQ